jgi:hypothetical protein
MILFNIFATGDACTVRVMTSELLQPRSMMRGCLLSPPFLHCVAAVRAALVVRDCDWCGCLSAFSEVASMNSLLIGTSLSRTDLGAVGSSCTIVFLQCSHALHVALEE